MRSPHGFTVLELMAAIVVVAILVALAIPAWSKLIARAQRVECMANLKNLHVAAEQYVQDNNQWPQIRLESDDDASENAYAKAWIAALAPYKATAATFICPTVENLLGNPDYARAGNERIDYISTSFDDKPTTPHQWPRQPWFVEVGDVHGHGNLIIFTDGTISDLKTVAGAGK